MVYKINKNKINTSKRVKINKDKVKRVRIKVDIKSILNDSELDMLNSVIENIFTIVKDYNFAEYNYVVKLIDIHNNHIMFKVYNKGATLKKRIEEYICKAINRTYVLSLQNNDIKKVKIINLNNKIRIVILQNSWIKSDEDTFVNNKVIYNEFIYPSNKKNKKN